MDLCRVNFINDVLSNVLPNRRIEIIRDNFINIMNCYNIALSYYPDKVKIIEHSDDYNMITLEISTNKKIVDQAVEILTNEMNFSGGLIFNTYQESFSAQLVGKSEDGLSFTVKIFKIYV